LFPAALKGFVDVVALLLERGASVNARDKEERTVLVHFMAEKTNANSKRGEEILKLLLDNGADVEARDTSKRTALIWASATGKVDMVRLLLEGKRKPNVEA
jgi:ankyrin repeat protein